MRFSLQGIPQKEKPNFDNASLRTEKVWLCHEKVQKFRLPTHSGLVCRKMNAAISVANTTAPPEGWVQQERQRERVLRIQTHATSTFRQCRATTSGLTTQDLQNLKHVSRGHFPILYKNDSFQTTIKTSGETAPRTLRTLWVYSVS